MESVNGETYKISIVLSQFYVHSCEVQTPFTQLP